MSNPPGAVAPELIRLLHDLMQLPELELFLLGGGTSLALRFGHRSSVDLELFTFDSFDSQRVADLLAARFDHVAIVQRTPGSLGVTINAAKIDFLHHPYPLLAPPDSIAGARLLSVTDVAAMKINAVTNRGSKKDFSDLLTLNTQGIPLAAALDLFCAKYGPAGRFLALRSLAWFEDAEQEPDPVYLNDWTWPVVREEMTRMVRLLSTHSV